MSAAVQIPINFGASPEAKIRLGNQHQAILARLRQGPATNSELSRIAQRFGGRIYELRAAGYRIDKRAVSEARGVFEYELTGEPE